MSTLKASRADNFYYPPYNPVSEGTNTNTNKNKNGALGKRKREDGTLTARLSAVSDEMHAVLERTLDREERVLRKKKIGKYLSTPIYSFVMLSHRCCNGRLRFIQAKAGYTRARGEEGPKRRVCPGRYRREWDDYGIR